MFIDGKLKAALLAAWKDLFMKRGAASQLMLFRSILKLVSKLKVAILNINCILLVI